MLERYTVRRGSCHNSIAAAGRHNLSWSETTYITTSHDDDDDEHRHVRTCATRPFQTSAFRSRPNGDDPGSRFKFHRRNDALSAVLLDDEDDGSTCAKVGEEIEWDASAVLTYSDGAVL